MVDIERVDRPSEDLSKIDESFDFATLPDGKLQDLHLESRRRCKAQEGVCRRVFLAKGDVDAAEAKLEQEAKRFVLLENQLRGREIQPSSEYINEL